MSDERLKQSQLPQFRKQLLELQGGRCALCQDPIGEGEAVLDHDHGSGRVRAVLHAGCNSMLGHIENNRPRYRLIGGRLGRMLAGAFKYIHTNWDSNPLHPLHRTEDEKRLLRNKRARLARAKKASS